ncbi:MAG: class I mannose-6-phosphate isomerase [Erysipelotrichaceae bacterium]
MKKIYRIKPVYEERLWGGQHLIEKYNYETDFKNIAESYCCIAIPGHLDCDVIDTGEKLSGFYHNNPDLFGSDTKDLPIRLTIESVAGDMSVQIHPEDDYALKNFNQYGKPGGVLYLEGKNSKLLLGHNAENITEFIKMSNNNEWQKLFRYVDYVPGDFIHIPANSLHAFRIRGTMFAFSRNSDVTLRLYDYDRLDPDTGKHRKTHKEEVFENVTCPDNDLVPTKGSIIKNLNLTHFVYHDVPGEYTAGRILTNGESEFKLDEFYFMFCVNGEGNIDEVSFKMGEVLFVPKGYGKIKLKGNMDILYGSYKNK